MTNSLRYSATTLGKVVAAVLSYLLVVAACAPLGVRAQSLSKTRLALTTKAQSVAPYRDHELLVRFRAGTSELVKDTISATQGARRKKQLRGESGVERLELRTGRDVRTAALELLLNSQIEFVEPNFLIAKDGLQPNDPQLNAQWALRNTGQDGGRYGSDIKATTAWQTTTGSTAAVVAVIDSGIDFTHPDLTNNQWTNPNPSDIGDLHGWDFTTDSGAIKDEQGHGTAVAGIIAAEGNNSLGITGVMWRASLMSLRVLDNTGTGDVADAAEAIDYAVDHGAQVINLSWGTSGESVVLKDAIERAIRRNVVVVCSAGNSSTNLDATPYYPASFNVRNLISVAASDNSDQLASWSNWGARSVTLAAPGMNILTTQRGGGYWNVSGTSAAAPIVAGIAGLLRTARPHGPVTIIAKAIADGARQTPSLAGKISSGGVADAAGALARLRGSNNQSLPFQTPGLGSGGNGSGGSFSTTPPSTTTGAPGANLPNLDEARNTQPQQPRARIPIRSNLPCADCDTQGGGIGAGNHPPNDPNFGTARGLPINDTGEPGVDLGSRNFNWSLPLLSLPGRAGLDLDLTLSYNSLVWTRDGSYMKFNADLGSPAPGFRLGLPTLQQKFLNSQTNIWAYIMVTPSGGRVELRQVGLTNIYESQDSSYTQLDASDPNALLVRTTNGTQLKFEPVTINSEYRCTEIKDRNGNYISATYNSATGHLLTITDTLERVVNFVYDGDNNLQAIRQTWAGTTHDWATFSYGQVYVSPAFGGGLQVNGPNNNYTTVLTQVSLSDSTYFTFNYNAAFAQVNRINSYAADQHLRSYTSYNVNSSSGQTECPRFTEQRDWADNWNNNNEAVTSYSVAADGSWTQVTMPDTTIYKEFFATSGWQTGLTTSTEFWSSGVKKKWTTTAWTQDDTNLSYQKNPRPSDTSIYDEAGNQRRSETIYTSYNLPNPVALPTEVKEYAADGSTVLRRTTTTYFDGGKPYIDRRVIGLLREVIVYDGNNQPQSKVWFDYDWGNDYWVATPQPATHHDASDVAASGRGNLCWTGRWDVSDVNNFDKTTHTTIKYNRTGSVIRVEDHYGIGNTISYTDSFSDAVIRNTFAYPTTVTDADGFISNAAYNFDFGAVTKTIVPSKGTGLTGDPVQYLEQRLTYDVAGRLDRVTNQNNGAYTRYVYLPYGSVQSFTQDQTVVERYNITEFDGAGRVRAVGMNHSNSIGGYSVQYLKYDIMGRLSQQSNPTEVNSSWAPTGDDSAWAWTMQSYDWKGRPLVTTNTDGSTRENTYGGCGCAGGETVTVRDERGRRRKLTMDVFARLKQVDELNWDQSVYATTTYTYNARDQITQSSQAGQLRTFEYDGFGRLWKRTTPEQGLTTFTYNADDTIYQIKDARNAIQTFSYNNRRLVTGINYDVSGDTVPTPNVSFTYDAAGHRTRMTDGAGTVEYGYNSLAQLTSETRTFTGLGASTLSYTYDLGGQLLSLTNSVNGSQVFYGYDHSTRVSGVTGSGYGGVSTYANNISYRAWSGLKSTSYGDGHALSVSYDNRMRPAQWSIPDVMRWNYAYNYFNENTGRVTYAQNLIDPTLDRSYDYDHVGRLIEARTASEARGHLIGQGGTQDGPYAQSYRYDQMGNMWYRVGWGGWFNPWLEQSPNYVNNRLTTIPGTSVSMTYDAAGNLTNDGSQTYTYDATGQQTYASGTGLTQSYDGDGLRVKKVESGATTYYLRSSVLGGQVIAEFGSNASRGYVYLGSQMLAIQQNNLVSWVHQDPVTKSQRITNSSGTVTSTIDLDPWGGETSRSSNQAFQPHRFTTYERDGNGSDEAMMRRYTGKWHRFSQPDPYEGSYDLTNPQSFNRYAYVQNDPVNLIDPTGLDETEWQEFNCQTRSDVGVGVLDWAFGWQGPCGGSGPGFRDPGTGRPGGSVEQPQTPSDTSEAEKLLTESCLKFLNRILAELGKIRDPYSFDFKDIFQKAKVEQKFHTVRLTPEQLKNGLGGTYSVIGDPAFYIELDAGLFNRGDLTAGYVMFHELFHGAPGSGQAFNHTEMARAAYSVALSDPAVMKRLGNYGHSGPPRPVDYTPGKYNKVDDWYNAGVFDAIVRIGCPSPPK
jgi:RHS repeat-associated protein